MIETSVEYLGDVRFAVTARGHRVICDQPTENQGADAGMTPPEFLLASLGACAAYYAAGYLRARSLPADGLAVRVVAEKTLRPARLSAFRIEITVPGLQDDRHKAGVLRAAKTCLIHNTLLQPPSIEVVLRAAVEANPRPPDCRPAAASATMQAGIEFGVAANQERDRAGARPAGGKPGGL